MLFIGPKITPVFSLDRPYPHSVLSDETFSQIKYRGFLFAIERPLSQLAVWQGDSLHLWPLKEERPELKLFLPHLPHIHQSGFGGDLENKPLKITFAVTHGRKSIPVAHYDWPSLFAERTWWERAYHTLPPDVIPPRHLIRLTQGVEDSYAYLGSIFTGAWLLKRLLPTLPLRVLDFGCGTGRLTLSWWILQELASNKGKITGVDLNPDLLHWAEQGLPSHIRWEQGKLRPPLPFASGSFDCIMLVSVFTHLSLETQRLWLKEFYRLLAPRGSLILTLHGYVYAQALLTPSQQKTFFKKGYFELPGPEGSNTFTSFHRPGFTLRLLRPGFRLLRFFKRGNLGQPFPFGLAFLQDVYLFQRL